MDDIVEHLTRIARGNPAAKADAPILSVYAGDGTPAVDLTRADLERAAAEITALRSALRECADKLAKRAERDRKAAGRSGSAIYERDMAPVLRARALLEPSTTEREKTS